MRCLVSWFRNTQNFLDSCVGLLAKYSLLICTKFSFSPFYEFVCHTLQINYMTSSGKYLVVPCVHLLKFPSTFYTNRIISKKCSWLFTHLLKFPPVVAHSDCSLLIPWFTKILFDVNKLIHWSNSVCAAAVMDCWSHPLFLFKKKKKN